MTFRHRGFDESEVMRELERMEAKRNPDAVWKPEPVKKKASASFKSDDPFHNTIMLVAKLRESGREADANSLMTKLADYEKNVHLYRAIDEDGEDLLDFAYPDGDAEVSPAQEEHGKVHTPQNAHKKIVDIVNKDPTGKYASPTDALLSKVASDLGLKKKAEWWWEDYGDIQQKVKDLTSSTANAKAKLDKIEKLYQTTQEAGVDTSFLSKELVNARRVYHAQHEELKRYKADLAKLENSMKERGLLKTPEEKKPEQKVPDWKWWRGNVGGKINRLAGSLTGLVPAEDIQEFRRIAKALYTSSSWEDAKKQMIAINPDNAKFKSIQQLDSLVMAWENWVRSQVKKAMEESGLSKKGIGGPPGAASPGGTAPKAPASPAKTPANRPAAAPAKASSIPEDEKVAVVSMQKALRKLADMLKENPNVDISDRDHYIMTSTGKGRGAERSGTAFDGAWGQNVKYALQIAKNFLGDAGKEIATDGPIGPNGLRADVDSFAERAEKNLALLNQAIKAQGGKAVDEVENQSATLLDNIRNTELFDTDLASFDALGDYFYLNDFLQTSSPAIKRWKGVLNTLKDRARDKYKTSTEEAGKEAAKRYFKLVDGLEKKLHQVISAYGFGDDDKVSGHKLDGQGAANRSGAQSGGTQSGGAGATGTEGTEGPERLTDENKAKFFPIGYEIFPNTWEGQFDNLAVYRVNIGGNRLYDMLNFRIHINSVQGANNVNTLVAALMHPTGNVSFDDKLRATQRDPEDLLPNPVTTKSGDRVVAKTWGDLEKLPNDPNRLAIESEFRARVATAAAQALAQDIMSIAQQYGSTEFAAGHRDWATAVMDNAQVWNNRLNQAARMARRAAIGQRPSTGYYF